MDPLSAPETDWPGYLERALKLKAGKGLLRRLSTVESPLSPRIRIGGNIYLHFSSNDYLGLANDFRMKKAAFKALEKWGTASGASPLIAGHTALYSELEKEIVDFKKTGSALVFASGYLANAGVIGNLPGRGDRIFSDALNHASIVDGCRLAGAGLSVYPHNDLDCLEKYLKQNPGKAKALVVSDAVFSMDGDVANIPDLYSLCRRYGAMLYVDDAHGTGVMGDTGRGSLEHFGLEAADIIQMGTFSKALGSLGAFVAGNQMLVNYLINKARTFIFSTALPPPVLAANRAALAIVKTDPGPRRRLKRLGGYLRRQFDDAGFCLTGSVDHIFSLITGSNADTVQAYKHLLKQGIYIPPIRPPTVPENKSRLRISLSALHSRQDIDFLVNAIKAFFRYGA